MKKINFIKRILLIAITFILCILIEDIIFFYSMAYKNMEVIAFHNKMINNGKIELPKYTIRLEPFSPPPHYNETFRPIMNENNDLNPILIFGCSFAHGDIFPNEETISYVMSKYSKRPIINRGANSWGIQHMYYQLKEEKSYFEKLKAPKYIFYVLMNDYNHFERLYEFTNALSQSYYLRYKIKNNQLVEKKPFLNLYYDLSISKQIKNTYYNKKINKMFDNNDKELFNFFIFHFKEINKLVREYWGSEDTKFVILTFEGTKKELWEKELENIGIDVIDIAEIIGKEDLPNTQHGFFEPAGKPFAHPVGVLWNELIPKLKEKYKDL